MEEIHSKLSQQYYVSHFSLLLEVSWFIIIILYFLVVHEVNNQLPNSPFYDFTNFHFCFDSWIRKYFQASFLFIMFITCQQLILNLRILNLCHEDEFVYSYNKKVNKAPNLYKICRFRIGYLMNKIMVHKIKINKKSLKLVVRSHELFPKPKKYIFCIFQLLSTKLME